MQTTIQIDHNLLNKEQAEALVAFLICYHGLDETQSEDQQPPPRTVPSDIVYPPPSIGPVIVPPPPPAQVDQMPPSIGPVIVPPPPPAQVDQMPPPSGPLTDRTGAEWNESIHSANKTMTKDGKWRLKKGSAPAAEELPSTPVGPERTRYNPGIDVTPREEFIRLLGKVTNLTASRVITDSDVTRICQNHGIAGLPLVATRLDLLPLIEGEIDLLVVGRS